MIIHKRGKSFYLILLFAVTFLSMPLASAFLDFSNMGYSVELTIDKVVELLTPFFQALFGDYGSTEFLFAKIMLFFLLVIVINAVMKKSEIFTGNKPVVALLSIIIPLLSIRYLQDNQLINGILLPYGTLGIAITTILPIFIFFYFVHFTKMGGFGRRMVWIFFIIVFAVLWNSRFTELSPISNQIYGWTLAFVVFSFIFDRNIHNYFRTWELNVFYKKANQKTVAALQSEYLNIIHVGSPEAVARKREIEAQLKTLGADLP